VQAIEVVGHAAVALTVAVLVGVGAREEGGYYVDVWAPLGLALLAILAVLVFYRRGPALLPSIGAAALVALGGWSVLSTQWGGIPNAAWTLLGQSIVAAAALLAASSMAFSARVRTAVYAGVLLGLTAHAVEILARVAVTGGPAGWFLGRYLQGPVGYHNAQATLFVLGLPLALTAATSRRLAARAVGGAATGALLGALILTQSRGALLAAGVSAVVLLAWSREIRLLMFIAPVLAAVAALLAAVRDVDAALVDGTAATHLHDLRRFVLWSGLAALALATTASANTTSRVGRVWAVSVASLTLALGVFAGFQARDTIGRAIDSVTTSVQAGPDRAPAGATRLTSLSLNGRGDVWRVAWAMARERPVSGNGIGQFSRRWGTERSDGALYVLQPHSLELELLGELGAIGLVAFAVFVVGAFGAAANSPSRHRAAVAGSVVVALLVETSVDWTWSFPAVVLPVMLIVGAAAGGIRIRRLLPFAAIAIPVVVAAAVVLAFPYLSDRQLDRGSALADTNADEAWTLALDAQRLDPWDEEPLVLQGQLAEAAGRYALAAAKYDRAASLSRQPWLDYFHEAFAWKHAVALTQLRRACGLAAAANPKEPLLRSGPCGGIG
jgi:O-antigen ligase/polysaccharide polymerase Wzy-like membrane protein